MGRGFLNNWRRKYADSTPSFVRGFGSVIDFWGQLHDVDEHESDTDPTAADWNMVGMDLRAAYATASRRHRHA